MSALDAGDIKKKLLSKFGFKPDDGTNHDTFRLYSSDGRQIAYVQVGRHKEDIGPSLYKYMALQAGVKTRQFADMIQCTIDKKKFLGLIGASDESEALPPGKGELPPGQGELPPGPRDE